MDIDRNVHRVQLTSKNFVIILINNYKKKRTGLTFDGPSSKIRLITGTKNAAVFPEPVCAQDIKSRQLFKVGIEYF